MPHCPPCSQPEHTQRNHGAQTPIITLLPDVYMRHHASEPLSDAPPEPTIPQKRRLNLIVFPHPSPCFQSSKPHHGWHFENITFQSQAVVPPCPALFGAWPVTVSPSQPSVVLPCLKAPPAQPHAQQHPLALEGSTADIEMF